MKGQILKGVGSFYTVMTDDGCEYVCKARGRFRKDRITPLPGDYVEFNKGEDGTEGYLLEILERKNRFIRPAVANLDKLIIVVSATVPKPDFILADKLLLSCEMTNVKPVLVVNKCDELPNKTAEQIIDEYKPTGYPIYCVSASTGVGIDMLAGELKDCVSCMTGQSAVGKSSILNRILPDKDLKTGEVSKKSERGRHTTRHAELLPLKTGGAVLDTPGFSLIDQILIEPTEIASYYPEMRKAADGCRFSGCMHISEPDCAIKELLKSGDISQGRYDRYTRIADEILEKHKHRYE